MIYVVTINEKEYEVEVESGKANIIKTTTVAAPSAPAAIASATAQAVAPAAVPVSAPTVVAAGSEVIKAPMPGTILDIKTQPGASIKKGDVLLILEAMKMENEILASSDGVVLQILVAKNASVSTGDVLAVIQ